MPRAKPNRSFAAGLRNSRMSAHLSQVVMAKRIGVARETYRGFESAKTEPTLQQAVILCDFLNMDINSVAKAILNGD